MSTLVVFPSVVSGELIRHWLADNGRGVLRRLPGPRRPLLGRCGGAHEPGPRGRHPGHRAACDGAHLQQRPHLRAGPSGNDGEVSAGGGDLQGPRPLHQVLLTSFGEP